MAKFPLEPLARIRANEVDEATRSLALAVEARVIAESRLAESRAAEARFLEMAADVARKESLAFASGVLRANDLAQQQAFEVGVSHEHEGHRGRIRAAARALDEANAVEARAREHLADRSAHAKAVERDREKFAAAQRRAAEAKEDEGAEEAHANARVGRRP